MIILFISIIENKPCLVVPGYVSQSIITPEAGEGKGIITGKILCSDGVTPLEVADPGFVEIGPGGADPIQTGTGADGIYSAEVDPGIYKVAVKVGEGYVGGVEGIIVEGGQTTGGVDVITSRALTFIRVARTEFHRKCNTPRNYYQ